jgi:FkbM family methyltransferase
LPAEHLLPEHQLANPLYDQFLPYIVQNLPPQSTVLDIGANVGDSLATMAVANPTLKYVCFEAEEKFIDYLKANIKELMSRYPTLDTLIITSLISARKQKMRLAGVGGTRRAEVSVTEGVIPVSLDALCVSRQIDNVSFIKSDVDGWDWDVISSGKNTIALNKPLLFFEMMVVDQNNLNHFVEVIEELDLLGYSHYYVFDCFGAFIFDTTSSRNVVQLGEYLLTQQKALTTRSIHYIDLLCGHGSSSIASDAVTRYSDWVKNRITHPQ